MGSNPTPRAYLGDLCDNFKCYRKAIDDRTTDLAHVNNPNFEGKQQKDIHSIITKRIDSLTKSDLKKESKRQGGTDLIDRSSQSSLFDFNPQ
ncbi:MAG: hypothetical protein AB7U98_05155 [Candidatus Nitrosocosmicus sp.]